MLIYMTTFNDHLPLYILPGITSQRNPYFKLNSLPSLYAVFLANIVGDVIRSHDWTELISTKSRGIDNLYYSII